MQPSRFPSVKQLPAHILALDGVRGLAIILVLILHLTRSSYAHTQSILLNGVIAFCTFGWAGVDLFFVLSGFLITGILFDTLNGPSFFLNFYARRFLRIFPLYYGGLAALLILSGPLGIHWHGSEFILLGYLQNVPPFYAVMTATASQYTGHLWSLAVEEQFYLLWPCIMFLVRDRKKLMIVALSLAALAPILRIAILLTDGLNVEQLCYKFTLCRMDSLLIGSALALAIRGPERSRILKFAPLVCAPLIVFCVGFDLWLTRSTLDVQRGHFFYSVGFTLLAISFAALIACVLRPASIASRIFQNAMLRWFGRYSYGIYVLHMIFANIYTIGTYPRLYLDAKLHFKVMGVALGGIPTLVITLVCAWLSYRFYESPFLRLKRYFERRSEPAPELTDARDGVDDTTHANRPISA